MRYPYHYMVFVSGIVRATLDRWTLFAGIHASVADVRACARKYYEHPLYDDDEPDVYVIRYCSSAKAFNSASFFVVNRSNGRLSPVFPGPSMIALQHSPDFAPCCR